MGLFSKTRRGHTARVRTLKRIIALGAATATLLTGVGSAMALDYLNLPGYNWGDHEHDLGILAYRDGMPVYCSAVDLLFSPGSQNAPFDTQTANKKQDLWYESAPQKTQVNTIAAMIYLNRNDKSDLTQAAVAWNVHEHFDYKSAPRHMWSQFRSRPLANGDINKVQAKAAELWAKAVAAEPVLNKSGVKAVVNNNAGGVVNVGIKNANGGYVPGMGWRIANAGTAGIKWDGPTSGTTSNKDIQVRYTVTKAGKFTPQVQYQFYQGRRMVPYPKDSKQWLFTVDPNLQWGSITATPVDVYPTYSVDVTTDHEADNLITGSANPVKDKLHVTIKKSDPAAQVDIKPMDAKVTLHFDGNKLNPPAQVTKDVTVTGAGDYESPEFLPSDLAKSWTKWESGSYYFTVHIDKTGKEMTGDVNTPKHEEREETAAPDKVWVLDKDGALVNSDHKGTNSIDWNHGSSDGKAADNETFLPGDPVSAVVSAPVPTGQKAFTEFDVEDDWTQAEKYVDFNHPELAKVYYGDDDKNMQDVTDQFKIEIIDATHTHAIANSAFLQKIANQSDQKWVKLVISGNFRTDYKTRGTMKELKNGGSLTWKNTGRDQVKTTNIPSVFTWTPNPDKVWVRNSSVYGTGKWNVVIDPDDAGDPTKTGNVGGDNKIYREGDAVGVVINGTVPVKLALKPNIVFNDDYSKSDYVWDPADTSKWRVFEQDATTSERSSIPDIIDTGKDVTSSFKFTVNGTMLTAAANDDYETSLMHLEKPKQITVLIPGKINLAQGKGNQQVYHDTGFDQKNTSRGTSAVPINEMGDGTRVVSFPDPSDPQGKKATAGYEVCQNPVDGKTWKQDDRFSNSASETAGKGTQSTNTPEICVWVPNSSKGIVAEAQYGGDQHDGSGDTHNGQGQFVRPGQNVEYRMHVLDHGIPENVVGYDVGKVVITDHLDPNVAFNTQTLKIVNNLRSGYTIPKTKYETNYDETTRTITVTFNEDTVRDIWKPGSLVDLDVIFEGNLSKNLPKDRCVSIDNNWEYTVNNGVSISNTLHNRYCPLTPPKQDTKKDPSISIDGKRLLLGDTGYYRLGLQAKDLQYDEQNPEHGKQLYRVQRLGMVDDYDDKYLKLDDQRIQVLQLQNDGSKAKDVTGQFNIQDKNGVLYVFAKTVDSINYTTGAHVYGNPQPKDLEAYWKKPLDKLNDPYIDQKLLGFDYQIVMPYKVIKVTDGYDVANQAIENVDEINYYTNWVHNQLKKINPKKDVVVNVGDKSVNGKDIYLHHYFLYRLDSSIRPTQLAYPDVTDWAIVDKLDPTIDRYTGQWAVYAARDLYKGEYLMARKGEKIAGSNFDSSKLKAKGALTYKRKDAEAVNNRTQDVDTELTDDSLFTATQTTDGTVTITANPSYRAMVSSEEHESGWTAYIQVQRMKPVEHHNNQFHEILNGVDRPSNIVWTRTPKQSPSMRIEKYDIKSGLKLGDRNKPSEALNPARDGTRIGLLIVNTGHSDLHRFTMADKTIAGDGNVTWDRKDVDQLHRTTLKPGQKFTVHGTLHGVSKFHTDRANVTSTPILPCPVPSKAPSIDKPQGGTSVKFCDSTPLHAHDDWNGKVAPKPGVPGIPGIPGTKGLANTGAGIALGLLAATALGLIGLGVTLLRRHHSAVNPSHAR